ncbi:hypothetical protein [Duganella qianjiadongensis]|uniref:DUF541 domain-containing protein n=1 Tax=Duganella qianjiadongensis TaxID=2692176 RepID=A0ABW9VPV9_9BURK|nr:hypothetical protein [Duganella qianjiadongensis]MYM41463.1 hypothetical protein [Duganella qianjiadongensis]
MLNKQQILAYSMSFRILLALLIAFSSSIAWSAENEKLPSEVMHDLSFLSLPHGYALVLIYKIEVESLDQQSIDLGRKVLADAGFHIDQSRTAGIADAKPVLKITGTKEYAAANPTADIILANVKQAVQGNATKFSWAVSQSATAKVQ